MVKITPDVATSIVPVVLLVMVKARSVEAVTPVYFKLPPASTSCVAALLAEPKLPAAPPLPIVPTLNVPALIVVIPV